MNSENSSEILIYQSEDGQMRIEVRFQDETAWLTQMQMTELFQTTKQNVSLHIKNVFEEGELIKKSVVKESLTTPRWLLLGLPGYMSTILLPSAKWPGAAEP